MQIIPGTEKKVKEALPGEVIPGSLLPYCNNKKYNKCYH